MLSVVTKEDYLPLVRLLQPLSESDQAALLQWGQVAQITLNIICIQFICNTRTDPERERVVNFVLSKSFSVSKPKKHSSVFLGFFFLVYLISWPSGVPARISLRISGWTVAHSCLVSWELLSLALAGNGMETAGVTTSLGTSGGTVERLVGLGGGRELDEGDQRGTCVIPSSCSSLK